MITFIEALIDITGTSVCLAVRSAVLCRMPDSFVGIVESGRSWTFALRILIVSVSMMIAPSILDSSRSRADDSSTSSSIPSEQIFSICSLYPSTISVPVFPSWIRSSPSRISVPGAMNCRISLSFVFCVFVMFVPLWLLCVYFSICVFVCFFLFFGLRGCNKKVIIENDYYYG